MPKTGRINIKGTKRVQKRFERQSYKLEFKQDVLKYWSECKSIDSTFRKFWPKCGDEERETKRKLLYTWKEQNKKIKDDVKSHNLHLSKIRPPGVSCILSLEIEQYLANWVRSLRNEGIPVSNTMVCLQAKILAEEEDILEFKAGYHWLCGFKDRFRLSSRNKSHQGQVAPDDVLQLAKKFEIEIKETVKKLGVKEIWV